MTPEFKSGNGGTELSAYCDAGVKFGNGGMPHTARLQLPDAGWQESATC